MSHGRNDGSTTFCQCAIFKELPTSCIIAKFLEDQLNGHVEEFCQCEDENRRCSGRHSESDTHGAFSFDLVLNVSGSRHSRGKQSAGERTQYPEQPYRLDLGGDGSRNTMTSTSVVGDEWDYLDPHLRGQLQAGLLPWPAENDGAHLYYRPNRLRRHQRNSCQINFDRGRSVDNTWEMLLRCWPDLPRAVALRIVAVDDSVYDTTSSRRADQVWIIEATQDVGHLQRYERLLLVEVQIMYRQRWISTHTRATQTIWRQTLQQVCNEVAPQITEDHRVARRLHTFRNGLHVPPTAYVRLREGDFIQCQYQTNLPVGARCARQLIDDSETDWQESEGIESEIEADDRRPIANSAESIEGMTNIIVYRIVDEGSLHRKAVAIQILPWDASQQIIRRVLQIWTDIRATDAKLHLVHTSILSDPDHRQYEAVYILEDRTERKPGVEIILTTAADTRRHYSGNFEVKWCPEQATINEVQGLLAAQAFCQRADVQCFHQHNAAPWINERLINVRSGDYHKLSYDEVSLRSTQRQKVNRRAFIEAILFQGIVLLCLFLFWLTVVLLHRDNRATATRVGGRLCFRRPKREVSGQRQKVKAILYIIGCIHADAIPCYGHCHDQGAILGQTWKREDGIVHWSNFDIAAFRTSSAVVERHSIRTVDETNPYFCFEENGPHAVAFTKSAIIGHRPNQEIQQDFDDVVPYTYRGIPGVIIAPPRWQEHPTYRTALATGMVTRQANGRLTMPFRSWVIKRGHPQIRLHRDFAMRPQLLVHLPDYVRRIWHDYISDVDWVVVHIVRPLPMAGADGARHTHVLAEINRPWITRLQPVLIATRQITADRVEDPEWFPDLLPLQFGIAEVQQVCRLACENHQILVPMAGRVRRWLTPYIQRHAQPGMFLPVWYDLRLRHITPPVYVEDNEGIGLFQTHANIRHQWKRHGAEHGRLTAQLTFRRVPEQSTQAGHCRASDTDGTTVQQPSPRRQQQLQVPDEVAASTFRINCDILVAGGYDLRRRYEVETFGLYVHHIGQRIVQVPDLTAVNIVASIRQAWNEMPFPFTAILVRPEQEGPRQIRFIVEFLDFRRMPVPGSTPTLQRVIDVEQQGVTVKAAYHIGSVQPFHLIGQVPLQHRCEPWTPWRCEVKLNDLTLPELSQARLEEGDRLDFYIHTVGHGDLELEGLWLMQRHATSRSPRRFTPQSTTTDESVDTLLAHIYHLSAEHRLVVLDRGRPLSFVSQLETVWGNPPHTSIHQLHEVRHPPADLVNTASITYIAEMNTDRHRQAVQTDQLALVDVVLGVSGSGESSHLRRVVWTRHFMTRASVLHLLAAHAFCSMPTADCSLELNQAEWHRQDGALRELRSGDFLRLAIQGPSTMTVEGLRLALCDLELAEAQRYIYHASPLQSPSSTSRQQEGGESEVEHSPDAPHDRHHETKALLRYFHGLCKHAVAAKTRSQLWRLQFVDKPHVLDLWCALDKDEAAAFGTADPATKHCSTIYWRYPHYDVNQSLCILGRSLPPGNGADNYERVTWYNGRLDAMDDIVEWQGQVVVIDFIPQGTTTSVRLPDLQNLYEQLYSIYIPCLHREQLTMNALDMPEELRLTYLQWVGNHDLVEYRYDRVDIYTDGSFSAKQTADGNEKTPATWAIVVTGTNDIATAILHAAAGNVTDDSNDPCWTGASKQGSREAEIEAILQALIWCINGGCRAQITIHFDATTAGWPIAGAWTIAPTNGQIRTARALWQLYDATHPSPIQAKHVKAHRGDLGNEIANMLANQARLSHIGCGAPPITFGPYITGRKAPIEWLWLNSPMQNGEPAGLPPIEDDIMLSRAPARLRQHHKAMLTKKLDDKPSVATTVTRLGVVTYNVCSLKADGGNDKLSQQEYLRKQLQQYNIQVTCLQETRARQDAMIESHTHIRLVAAAEEGRGGTEVWLLKRNKEGQSTGLTRRDVLVLHRQPELLIVRVQWKLGSFVVVSGHAPHGAHAAQEIEQWWAQLRQCLVDYVDIAKDDLILGLDANAHFTEEALPGVSAHGLETRVNRSGKLLQRLVNDYELMLPSTFEEWHIGETHTWQHGYGQSVRTARCDYIAIPYSWRTSAITSQPIAELDSGTTTRDHTALLVHIQRTYVKPPSFRVSYDRERIAQIPECHYRQLGKDLQQIQWDTNVHEQAISFTDIINEWLQQHSPVSPSGPRKGYIRNDTWNIRTARTTLIRMRRKLQQLWARHKIQVALYAWRMTRPYTEQWDDQLHVAIGIIRELRLLESSLDTSKRKLSQSLRADRTMYLEEIAKQAEQGDPKDLFKRLRQAGVGGRRKRTLIQPLPTLRNEQGDLVTSFREYAETWRLFFAAQEDGVGVTPEQLLDHIQHGGSRGHTTPIEWQDLPTLTQVERALRQTKIGKAVYDDQIPGELLHYGAKYLAPAALNLLYKQWLCNEEAALFKGGALIPAYKGKGDSTQCASYRSLLISSTLGKVFHRLFRDEIMQTYIKSPLPMQYGGRPHISVLQAVHSLQLFQHMHYQAKQSTALLFVDISNAFYRLLRQQLVQVRGDTRSPMDLFANLNLPDEAYEEFKQHVQSRTAMDDMQCPQFLSMIAEEYLTGTWYTVHGTDTMTRTRRGSRPGDTVADLFFSIAFRYILKKVQRSLQHLGISFEISWSGLREPIPSRPQNVPISAMGPVWADDLCIMLVHSCAQTLLTNTQAVAGQLFDELVTAGMSPNLAAAKTEVMLTLCGTGSVAVRKQICFTGAMLETTSQWLRHRLRVVGSYRHLGVWITVKCRYAKALRMRLGMAHETFTQQRAAIFANRGLSWDKKKQLFYTLIMSGLTYATGVFMPLNRKDMELWTKGLHKLYRRMAQAQFGLQQRHWNDRRLRVQLQVPHPQVVLRAGRLSYLQHLVRAGDDTVWAMAQQTLQWWALISEDLEWLRNNVVRPELPAGGIYEQWEAWQQMLQRQGKSWTNMVKKGLKHAVQQERKDHDWEEWQTQCVRYLIEADLLEAPLLKNSTGQQFCGVCRQTFRTMAAWSVHAFKKHGRVTYARTVAQGTQCQICLKQYPTHVSLINHLKYSVGCFQQLQQRGFRARLEPAMNSRQANQEEPEWRPPVLRADGPPLPDNELIHLHGPNEDQLALLRQWHRVWNETAEHNNYPPTILEMLRDTLTTTTLPIAEIQMLALYWRDDLVRDGIITEMDGLHWALTRLEERITAAWALRQPAETEDLVTSTDEILDAWLQATPRVQSVPRPLRFRQVVLAHLFSGRRRPGDIQQCAEEARWITPDGCASLSVDIIFHEKLGNLLHEPTRDLFIRAAAAGILTAVISGPPCETWTVARNRDDGGPRQIRTIHCLRGLQRLTFKELAQILVGNGLLGATILLALVQFHYGNFMLVEHPSEPTDLHAASIWRIAIVQLLERFEGVQRCRVWQGHYGAKSPKPTDILVVHGAPGVEVVLKEHRVSNVLPNARSIGRTADNKSWQTTALKEYPVAFCRAIVGLVQAHVQSRGLLPIECLKECPADIQRDFGALQAGLDHTVTEIGPDFNPAAAC